MIALRCLKTYLSQDQVFLDLCRLHYLKEKEFDETFQLLNAHLINEREII